MLLQKLERRKAVWKNEIDIDAAIDGAMSSIVPVRNRTVIIEDDEPNSNDGHMQADGDQGNQGSPALNGATSDNTN